MNTKPCNLKKLKLEDISEDTQENLPNKTFIWSAKEYQFLVVYRQTLDIEKAKRETEMSASHLSRLLNDNKMKQALEKAKQDFADAAALDGNCAKSNFMRVFNKIEKRFDNTQDKYAGSLAGSLSAMTATALRATGQLEKENTSEKPMVSININLGEYTQKNNIKDIVIEDNAIIKNK